MSEDVHIVVSTTVREQLRRLEPTKREAIVDGLYRSLVINGRRIRLPGLSIAVYAYSLDGYSFFYRELSRKELAHAGKDSGYLVFDMRAMPMWIKDQMGG